MQRPGHASYLSLLYVVGLLALLVVLAVLQYRWTGEASLAEQERMRQGLNESLGLFERGFDREISQVILTYWSLPLSALDESSDWRTALAPLLADASREWQASADDPRLVSRIFVVESRRGSEPRIYSFSSDAGRLDNLDWPDDLTRFRPMFPPNPVPLEEEDSRERIERRHLPGDFTIDQVPALVHVLVTEPIGLRQARPELRARVDRPRLYLVACLDREYLFGQLLPSLADGYLSREGETGYDYAIASRQDPTVIMCGSAGANLGSIVASPDGSVSLFQLRSPEIDHLSAGLGRRKRPPPARVAGSPSGSPRGVPGGGGGPRLETPDRDRAAEERALERYQHFQTAAEVLAARGWQLFAKHRSGSLNAVVSSARLRNLGVSLGILLLLAVSLVVLTVSVRRAQRLSRQQMEFVAGVSHELRTPIAVICSSAENLADGVITAAEQVRRYGQYILREGWRLDTLVEQTMEFAGIGSGIRRFHMESLDLGGLITETVNSFRTQIVEKQLNIDVSAPAGATVRGDAPALSCAIGNLVSNAVKYSRAGGQIRVALEVGPETAAVTVTDHGIGIESGDIRHLFEPFFRGSNARRAQIRGAGIGLSLVKNIVEAHHGTISVKSRINEGSTFTLLLPLAPVSDASEARLVSRE